MSNENSKPGDLDTWLATAYCFRSTTITAPNWLPFQQKLRKTTVQGKYQTHWNERASLNFVGAWCSLWWSCSYSIFGCDASNRKWKCKESSSPWKPRLDEKTSTWREEAVIAEIANVNVSVTPWAFHEGYWQDICCWVFPCRRRSEQHFKVNPVGSRNAQNVLAIMCFRCRANFELLPRELGKNTWKERKL